SLSIRGKRRSDNIVITVQARSNAMNLADHRSWPSADDGQPKPAPDRFYYHGRTFQIYRVNSAQPLRANADRGITPTAAASEAVSDILCFIAAWGVRSESTLKAGLKLIEKRIRQAGSLCYDIRDPAGSGSARGTGQDAVRGDQHRLEAHATRRIGHEI